MRDASASAKRHKGGIQSIVVGEIRMDELQSFDTALSTGLGLGKTPRSKLLSQTDSGKPTKSANVGCTADLPRLEKELRIVLNRCLPTGPDDIHRKAHSSALQTTGPPNVCGKEVRLTLNKLDMTPSQIYLTDRNIVIDARLATLRDHAVIGDPNAGKELVSYSSHDTEAYWPLDPKKQKLMFPNVNVMHPARTSNQKTTQKFKIQVHGIRCRRNHYYFKCFITGYNKTFSKILNWNLHHLTHKTKVKCRTCGHKFATPVLTEHTRTYMQHPNLNACCVRKTLHSIADCINTQTFITSLGCTSVSMAPAKRHLSGLRTWQDIFSVT